MSSTSGPSAPAEAILNMSYSALVIQRALYAFAKMGFADVLKDRRLANAEIAGAVAAHPRAVYRLLRTLSVAGIVTEAPGERFALTPLGQLLRSDAPDSMRAWVVFSGAPAYLRAWEEIVYSIETGKPAWDCVHGAAWFEYLGRTPDAARVFDEAMTSLSHAEALTVARAYDFSRFQRIVDVGGGHGTLLMTILEANPGLRGVLFDQPQVVGAARERIAATGFAHRIETVAGDFFESIPAGADAYIMKYIVHDWDDERAVTLLQNCRRAMPSDARLLIVETVVPPPDERHFAKIQDLEMLVLLTGQERTLEEYKALLKQTGLKVTRVTPTAEPHSIIEAVPV